jgi:hypothetical protein
MKKYIQPRIGHEDLLSIQSLMLTESPTDDPIGGGSGEGDAKSREEIEELMKKDGWEDGLW